MKRRNISPSVVNAENDRIKRRQYSASTSTSTSNVVRRRSLNLNELPDQILLHILSFLPTNRNTVRTTTLISQKWRKLWLSTPSLNFHKMECGSDDFRLIQRFASFVNQTLNRRPPNTPLLTFDLKLNFQNGVSASQIDSWICYAASHGVENLHLVFDFPFIVRSLTFEFDFRLLRNSRVRVLKLRGCNLSLPPPPPQSLSEKNSNIAPPPPFSSLRSVELDGVGTTDEVIVELVASCVNLEVLVLLSVKGCKDFKIHSSKLRVLKLEDFKCEDGSVEIVVPNLKTLIINFFDVGSYALMDVSSLVEANLHFDEFRNWVKVIKFIGHVKHLNTFNGWFQLMYSKDTHSECVLQNLKYVELGTYSMKTCVIGIALLLKRSPNLQTLILHNLSLFNKAAVESISDDFMEPTFSLPCLKQVRMKYFMGMDAEKRLITLLLKWSVILERIILIPAVGLEEAPKPPIVLDCKLNSHSELEYFVSQIPRRRRFISLE